MLHPRRFAPVAMILAALVAAGCGSSQHPVPKAALDNGVATLVPTAQLLATHLEPVPSPVTARGSFSGARSAIAMLAAGALANALDRLPRGTSAVAWATTTPVSVYPSSGARRPQRSFPTHDQFGIPQVFLVKRATPGWLEVYVPVRPNGSTGWVRTASVGVTLDPYRVVVDTARHKLTTLLAGRVVRYVTVGIGKPATPTPHGLFFVVEKLRVVPPTGPYGTYAIGLSAFSNVLTSFGTGPGQVAVHGTNDASSIGQGTSNGCVHLSNSAVQWLANTLPLGTPVQII